MAQAYLTQCERLLAAGRLTAKLLLAYQKTGRLTQVEYEGLYTQMKQAKQKQEEGRD